MVNKKKPKSQTPVSEERKEYLRQLRRQVAQERHRKEHSCDPLPAKRTCKTKDHHEGCPVCPGTSDEHTECAPPATDVLPSTSAAAPSTSAAAPSMSAAAPSTSAAAHSTSAAAPSTSAAAHSTSAPAPAVRSRPILQAVRRFSYHHRKLSLSTQRRPQSLGSGLRTGLFRRQHPSTLLQQTDNKTQRKIQQQQQQHSASSIKLSNYLRRAKRKFRKTNTHVPLVTRPIGNRIFSCIQLEKSVGQLGCGSCGKNNMILEEKSTRRGWATYIRWKCSVCEFATEWTSSSPRVSPKGAFEVSTIMYNELHPTQNKIPPL